MSVPFPLPRAFLPVHAVRWMGLHGGAPPPPTRSIAVSCDPAQVHSVVRAVLALCRTLRAALPSQAATDACIAKVVGMGDLVGVGVSLREFYSRHRLQLLVRAMLPASPWRPMYFVAAMLPEASRGPGVETKERLERRRGALGVALLAASVALLKAVAARLL